MAEKQTWREWTGVKGRIGGWYLNSPLRRLSEILLLGDCKSAFLRVISPLIRGNEVILDIGAGSGYFSLDLAKKISTGKVICVDMSAEMLGWLGKKAEKKGVKNKIQIVKSDATSSGLADGSIDIVISNGLLHEVPDPGAVLREMTRVLKPNGRVIITDFRDTKITRMMESTHRENAHGPFSVDELTMLFNKVGLKKVKVGPEKFWVIGTGKK